jgi:hypothetical protein
MEAFNEGFKQYVKGKWNPQYGDLPQRLKNLYDLLDPKAIQEIDDIRQGRGVSLVDAFQRWLSEPKNKLRYYQSFVPPETTPHGLRASPRTYGQYNDPTWKR